jgi:hypothetical protein
MRLAAIVASGLHQLAAAAAHQIITDKVEAGRASASVWDSIDTVAGNLAQPYISALAQLAGADIEVGKTSIADCNANKVGTDDTDRQNTDLQGAMQLHGKPSRGGAAAKRSGRK